MNSRSFLNDRRLLIVCALLLVLLTSIVYLPSLGNDFVLWDDDVNVLDNIHIRSFDRTFLEWAFTDLSTGTYWHPLAWITYAADYALWRTDARGYHLTALLLHAVNTFLVVLLVGALAGSGGTREAPGAPEERARRERVLVAALVAGALFGLHPIHVESVAWISERKDLLYSLFTLLSVLAYLRHVREGSGDDDDAGRFSGMKGRWYVLSVAAFAAALASKPMAVTLPVILLLIDWYPLGRVHSLRGLGRVLTEKVPYIALSVIVTVVTLAAQRAAALMPALSDVPFLTRVLVACRALAQYLWKLLVPLDLLPLYPYPKSVQPWSVNYLIPVAIVVAITAWSAMAARTRRVFLASWLYFVISLLPVLGLLQVGHHFMADRFVYLASIGPFLLAGLGAGHVWSIFPSGSRGSVAARSMLVFGLVILGVMLSWWTVKQISVWKDSVTLWTTVIERAPVRVSLAYNNRGIALAKSGQSERALQDFSAALELDPDSPYTYNNRGRVHLDTGEPKRAIADFTSAIELDRSYAVAYVNRGNAYRQLGKVSAALNDYAEAIHLRPDLAEAYVRRGIVHGESGRLENAIEDFTTAIGLDPFSPDAYTARGLSLEQSGKVDQAIADLDRAIELDPGNVDAYLNRGVAYESLGKHERAIKDYDKAIGISPSDFLLYCNRGIVFRELGKISEAIGDYTKALSLKPDFAHGYAVRGDLYLKAGRSDLAHRDYQQACYLGSEIGCAAMQKERR